MGLYRPTIIDVGPGGSVNFLLDYLPEGEKRSWNYLQRFQRGFIRPVETLMRQTHLFPLETSEPEEIAYLFKDLYPAKIYVVDSEPKVIGAVMRIIERNGLPWPIECIKHDIVNSPMPCNGEIVFAYNVIQRTSDSIASLKTIANSVTKGGLLSITFYGDISGFEKVDYGLFLKNSYIRKL